jgi:AbrB family looped-hinge helix DNA binding protein
MVAQKHSKKVRVGRQGRIVIPASLRDSLSIKEGDVLTARQENGRLVLESRDEILKQARALFAHIPKEISLVDILIADRRAEARREAEELSKLSK